MRLTELEPRWVGDSGRHVGVSFKCPHCHDIRIAVAFANPSDGGPASGAFQRHWQRTGETFEDLTLTPSIDTSDDGHWHGFITNGEVT